MKSEKTDKQLKEFVKGVGLWCVTIKNGEYVSIGESLFIGAKQMNYGTGIRLSFAVPRDIEITHYQKLKVEEPSE